jgi:hypothetical protein
MTSPLEDYRLIPLTQGQFAIVDACNFDWLNQWKWRTFSPHNSDLLYAVRGHRAIYMHREIMKPSSGMVVDHINHNALDNRLSNLRVVTQSQNIMNRRINRNNKTGLRGVELRANGRFLARIRVAGKAKHLGVFDTPEEAYSAYCAAADKYFGEFAGHRCTIIASLRENLDEIESIAKRGMRTV